MVFQKWHLTHAVQLVCTFLEFVQNETRRQMFKRIDYDLVK